MKTYDVAVIGGGLAGLECASILSKEGMSVVVIEQGDTTGGFFQPFKRRGKVIDSSVHYIGSLDEGQFMERFFSYLDITNKVDFVRMDNNEFESVYFNGKCYPMAMGHKNFADRLAEYFPQERENLRSYIDTIKKTSYLSIENVRSGKGFSTETIQNVTVSVDSVINSLICSPVLRKVLTGNSIIYSPEKDITPFYVHAMANNSYIESSWRIRGGAFRITDALTESIRKNGGDVKCRTEVKSILTKDKKAVGVETNNGEKIFARKVISSLHPQLTTNLLGPDAQLKESYRRRIGELKNSGSLFSLYVILKPNIFKYINKNLHLINGRPLMVSFQPPAGESEYADVVTLITPMSYDEVAKWGDSTPMSRGDDYLEFKNQFAEELIKRIEEILPDFRKSIDFTYSATPLTFRDYVKTPFGSVYGVMKDCNKPLSTFLPVKSRVENLYMAGQSINLHGVMGVTFTSLLTCSEILGNGLIVKMGL